RDIPCQVCPDESKRAHVRLGCRPQPIDMDVLPPDRLRWFFSLRRAHSRRVTTFQGDRILTPPGEPLASPDERLIRGQEFADVLQPGWRSGPFLTLDRVGPLRGLPAIQPFVRPFLPPGE